MNMSEKEREDLVEAIAQAVIERIEARERMKEICEKVISRLQEVGLIVAEEAGRGAQG